MNHTVVSESVVKKYAQAFMSSSPHAVVFADVKKIEKAYIYLRNHRRILFFLQLPQLAHDAKISMLEDLIDYFSLPHACLSLFFLLIRHNRSFYIPQVLFFIVHLYKEKHDIVDFSIISAHSLTDDEIELVKNFLSKSTRKNVICTHKINKALIAGLRLQSSEYRWEYSVLKQIEQLKRLET